MEQQTWKCLCGTENSGNFCSTCGRAKDNQQQFNGHSNSFTEQYFMMQMQQQELAREQEERRLRLQEEKECKQKEYTEKLNAYNNKVVEAKSIELKKWAGSWVVLVLAILSSITTVCTYISLFTSFAGGIANTFSFLINAILVTFVCIGFWLSYAQGKSKGTKFSVAGPKMLRGILIFYKVIMFIVMIALITLVLGILAIYLGGAQMLDELLGTEIPAEAVSIIMGVFIGLLVAIVIVFIVLIIYFSLASKFSKNAIVALGTKNIGSTRAIGIAVFFFIIGAFLLISALSASAVGNLLSEIIYELVLELGPEMSDMLILTDMFQVDVVSIISMIADALMYIFAGILAIQFNGLAERVRIRTEAIEKPQI